MDDSYVYGDVDGNLIFVRRDLAQRLSALRSEFANWGEARAALDKDSLDEISSRFSAYEVDQPDDETRFELDDIPGHVDGDWPEWPAKLMLVQVPKSVVDRFGRVEDSVLNGQFLMLQPESEAAIVAELQAHGWVCLRDDVTVLRACGY
ncbi:hypothetical protein HQ305_16845 [Rhodococcus sp. BP-149]|uniref:hypothetical protein n=1 Tax=unclassified Rhodococcus (in: high G+C Gram-positive bacteria) TaxID=192944 RepID=UPI001C9B164A|nr:MULTISPECIES: hypothetical protein [unclassified Rhodococcus (in: high G+C Gram-positive bacteria)]MBY6687229.1 hypothetical protein [Rhodococcus sp. BP-288]MBY6694348.1 hypothetical protein [Rhodococcus sp. BP-188]MBY6698057.1 hypothetical protein [Rhodococcus sp. BP-285]MBY6704277.1 hypothetical protein [Rhodococcus sp. BP-283]MBY6712926.1 hypothetical protein [Rhodococcus sp. BP-160]